MRDGTGTRAERLEFTAALVLTYCDGRHDVSAIADAVAGSVGHADRDALHADVQRILEDFASGGLVT